MFSGNSYILGGGEIPISPCLLETLDFTLPAAATNLSSVGGKCIVWTAFIDSLTRRRRLPTENGGAAAALKKEERSGEGPPCRSPSMFSLPPHSLPHCSQSTPKYKGGAGAAASLRSGGGLRRRKERIGLRRRRRRRNIKHKALQKSGTYYYCSPVRSPTQCLAGSGDDW